MRTNIIHFLALLIFIAGSAQIQAQEQPTKATAIVVTDNWNCTKWPSYALALQIHLEKAGVHLPIVTESLFKQHGAMGGILLGPSLPNSQQLSTIYHLDPDGFYICSDQHNLCIGAIDSIGLQNGVYDYLERYLGFRLYTPTALVVPHLDSVIIPPYKNEVRNPSFAYREVLYYYPNHSQYYADWHKLHNRADLNQNWGMFVHTFQHLLPTSRYFETHPEWFSEINGVRVRDGQLCLSNNEVLDTLCHNLAVRMQKRPEATIWSVSNNDNTNACTCPKCQHLDSLYGGPSGTLIHFVNQVARRFPDKTISTLAYQFTRQAPKGDAIKPDSNVNIMFCSIECGRQEAIATAPGEKQFRQDMQDWNRLSNNIFMWDYIVQFRNFLDPFPNLHVLKPNLQFFHQNGVKQIFEQGTGENNKTSWMELRTYLVAKLMWDVDISVSDVIHDFCNGYYGAAGPYVEEYFCKMERALIRSGKRLDIYGYPIDGADGYLSPSQIHAYQALLSKAYNAVEGDTAYTNRLRYLELSLDFAILDIASANLTPELSYSNPKMIRRADQFVTDCKRFGIHYLHEMGYTPEEYRKDIDNYIHKSQRKNLAQGRPVKLQQQPASQYFGKGAQSLTDGVAGILNYHNNWIGFFGETMDATIDLGKKQYLNALSIDFYFYPLSWIFLPANVTFYVSRNGKDWTAVDTISHPNPPQLAVPRIVTFKTKQLDMQARYIRIVAKPLPQIPDWHRAVGNPCWIFTDEILVD